jgi:hypothetical protein
MMITKTLLAAGVALVALAAPAQAALTFSNGGGDGFIVAPDGPWDFTLVGNNNGQIGIFTTNSAVAAAFTSISGTFRYQTNDRDGSGFDPAGYFVNSTFTKLSAALPKGGSNSGSFAFTASAGDTYGFYVNSTDGQLGTGELSISAVPEPASWAMLIAGFGLVGAVARRRRTAVAA